MTYQLRQRRRLLIRVSTRGQYLQI